MEKNKPIAIALSDLHLSVTPPACRADKDWLATQAGYLQQVKELRLDLGSIPVICAGDIFDKWNPTPELIHFALTYLPTGMYSVPGQHDLPNHRIEDMDRSGYGVLKKVGKIKDLSEYEVVIPAGTNLALYGFGWGQEIQPLSDQLDQVKTKAFVHVAVIHRYCWEKGHSYPGAPDAACVTAYKKSLKGFDAAVFGDNHKGFISQANRCTVLNCGGFIRRKSDEIHYKPSVGLIYSDGSIQRHYLDTSGDSFHENGAKREEHSLNMKEFLESLQGLGEQGMDFRETVKNHLRGAEDMDPETKEIILQALEGKVKQ